MAENPMESLDDIDRYLVRILADNPRAPYTEIAERLEEKGFEMTGQGVRYRVSRLLEATSVFFLLAPEEHGWEIVRIGINVENRPNAKAEVFEGVCETGAWLVCRGMGSFDVWAVGTVGSNQDADDLVSQVRGLDGVENVEFFLETGRATYMEDYLSL